jgi:hypothetical protein
MPVPGRHDVGRIVKLTVRRPTRTDFRTVPARWTVVEMRQQVPLGKVDHAMAAGDGGRVA